MDDRAKTSSDQVGLLKSWMPWMSDPAHVSRDFWMPDKSCRVCYECDSKFKLFNRRHHCRLCGRIFCSKCTSNWVPTESKSSSENCDRIRVCNYCFKQWEKDLVGPADNGVQVTSLNINNSALSENSYISTKSSETCCSNATFFSMLQSTGLSPLQSPTMKTEIERQSFGASNDHVADKGEENMSQDQFEFYGRNRSDDEDEEFALPRMDSQRSHFSHANDYYGNAQFDDISTNYTLKDDIDSKIMSRSSVQISFDSPNSKEVEHDIVDEFEASSSVYVAEDVNTEPVDFEDNGILWLPPEPEDKEDEREALLFEDDDDGQGAGEWGYLHKSSSFGSEESRGKDESNEGQKKVMKTVVEAHFRALVAQLLQAENLLSEEENDKESWLEIVIALSWEAATLLKPDTSKGGQMDPGGYVKVKCLASGLRSESSVVKGIVFKKNVAHRRMALKIEKPRLLILGGALEYHRVSNAFSSVDTLLKQETDHLKMAIAKIDAHKPRILLVEKSVSRYAQDYLLAKDISLVLNIKRPILERIARCTGAQIVPSIDHLSSSKLGYCEMFHVERCSEEHGTLGQAGKRMAKTLMYFEGCPKPLGCTILLRGANEDELKKVKHVIQYGVFAAYHLALETSFLADEGASLSEFPLNPPIAVALLDKAFAIDTYISTVPQSVSEQQRSNIVPTSDLINGTTASVEGGEFSETSNLPMTPNNVEPFFMPSIEDFQHSSLNEPSTHHASENQGFVDMPWSSRAKTFETNIPGDLGHLDTNIMQSNNFETDASGCILDPSSLQTDGKQISDEELASKEEFPPSLSDNQSILVSLSSRCVWKGTVCERSQMFRIKYYGNSDKPLGRFLRDHLFDQNYICRSCEMPAEAHVQCYTHRQGTLTISVKKLPEIILPGEKDGKIWMWHRCLRCPRVNGFPPATRRIVMSDAAWGLSFGKFLELSFSNHAAASRVANCGHSLHRDCLRFYGFGKRVACFRYASIDVHSVYLPPSKLDFNYESQEWIERELDEVVGRAEHLFSEVLNALDLLVERKFAKGIAMSGTHFSESKRQISDLEGVLQKEKSELEETFQKILNKDAKKGQPVIDILELNRLRRQLIFQSYIWDHRLIYTASSDVENQPNDIKVTQKPPGETEKISDICDMVNLESNVADAKEPDQNPNHVQTDTFPSPVSVVSETKSSDESNPLISSVTVRRAFSNGQDLNSLSETLESAWTGESQSDSFDVDNVPQSPSVLSSRGSDNVEETVSWLSMSFVSFYRSLNKNFHGPTQKLDTLGEYDPVYISSFRDSELQGGARLLLPVGINDIVIPVYDDEPTSIISYALLSPDYFVQLKDTSDSVFSMQHIDVGSFNSLDEANLDSSRSLRSGDESMMSSSMSSRSSLPLDPALHARVSFSDDVGKVKYTVTCYYSKHFESLRKICCPSEADFVRSLSRCKKWGAQGGKSNVFFAKTLDDRFIVKQVTKTELESFIKFAPGYFNYLSEAIVTRSPTCLAKTLGIYQVTSKHLKGGKETKMDVLVMENILFGRNVTRLYDLKGSSRSRYNPDSSGSNKVLLDQNLIEAMPTSPIFVGNKAKKMLERAVWNDTAFLASIDVMDYSLLVGVDEEKQELVLGIIDFMRQYTWDKHLETWVKASGILGGPKNASPTVISPLQYKRRFRKAMTTYFLMVPDQWSPPLVVPVKEENEFSEDNSDMGCA